MKRGMNGSRQAASNAITVKQEPHDAHAAATESTGTTGGRSSFGGNRLKHREALHWATQGKILQNDQEAVASGANNAIVRNLCGNADPDGGDLDDERQQRAPPRKAGQGVHPELLSPLRASSVGRAGLRAHVVMLRTESVQRIARPLLGRLMTHSSNRGIFNEPVNAQALKLPDYHRIVKNPIDLGTIKGRLLSLEYDELEPFIDDMRRCFANARLYNPPTNHVHKAALALTAELEEELKKLEKKLARDEKRRVEQTEQECGLCGEKCLKLEPVMLMCSGACNQRIKRGAPYFITQDGSRLWCQKCHTGLSSVLPPSSSGGDPEADWDSKASALLYKRDLLKRTFDEDIAESWVQCSACEGWFHQSCALFNRFYGQWLTATNNNSSSPDALEVGSSSSSECGKKRQHNAQAGQLSSSVAAKGHKKTTTFESAKPFFACPLCCLGEDAKDLPAPWLHRVRNGSLFTKSSSSSSTPRASKKEGLSARTMVCEDAGGGGGGGDSNVAANNEKVPSLSVNGMSKLGRRSGNRKKGSLGNGARREIPESAMVSESEEVRWDAPALPTTYMSDFIQVRSDCDCESART